MFSILYYTILAFAIIIMRSPGFFHEEFTKLLNFSCFLLCLSNSLKNAPSKTEILFCLENGAKSPHLHFHPFQKLVKAFNALIQIFHDYFRMIGKIIHQTLYSPIFFLFYCIYRQEIICIFSYDR